MIQDCKAILIPNLKVPCCLKHIVEMNEICERRMISHKYYKFLVKSLHKFNQTNTFFTTDINLPTSISFMSILSKAMCHFFSLGNFSFSKFLNLDNTSVNISDAFAVSSNLISKLYMG